MKKAFFALMCVAMMALVSSCAKSKTEIVLEEFENLIAHAAIATVVLRKLKKL